MNCWDTVRFKRHNFQEVRPSLFSIAIDRESGLPLYLQIKDRILYEISVANLPPGTVLPSIRQLASQLNVATATVRHAYASLEAEGFVVTRQGKGMLVGELNAYPPVEDIPYREQIVSLFTSAIARAHATGTSMSEIKEAIVQAMARWEGLPKVLFVGAESTYLEHYRPYLLDAFKSLAVDVTAILLQDFEQQPLLASDWLVPPLCVVTLVRSYARVRKLIDDSHTPIIAMALHLSDETKRSLMEIPREAQTVLVSERSNLAGFQHLAEGYLTMDTPLVPQAVETGQLSEALAHADVVLHSLRTRQATINAAPSRSQLIELHFEPDPLSLARIREAVTMRLRSVSDDVLVASEPAAAS